MKDPTWFERLCGYKVITGTVTERREGFVTHINYLNRWKGTLDNIDLENMAIYGPSTTPKYAITAAAMLYTIEDNDEVEYRGGFFRLITQYPYRILWKDQKLFSPPYPEKGDLVRIILTCLPFYEEFAPGSPQRPDHIYSDKVPGPSTIKVGYGKTKVVNKFEWNEIADYEILEKAK